MGRKRGNSAVAMKGWRENRERLCWTSFPLNATPPYLNEGRTQRKQSEDRGGFTP